MLNVAKRLDQKREEYRLLEKQLAKSREQREVGRTDEELKQQMLKVEAAIEELCEVRAQMEDRQPSREHDYRRTLVIRVFEEMEGGHYEWSAVAELPDGTLLARSLSDNQPYSPGSAVEALGRILDAELANDRWQELHEKKEGA